MKIIFSKKSIHKKNASVGRLSIFDLNFKTDHYLNCIKAVVLFYKGDLYSSANFFLSVIET